jgi:ATP-binding cassette subfamily B protein
MSSNSAWKKLSKHVADFRGLFALGLAAMIAVTAGQLAGPLILKSIIDDSIPKGDVGGMFLRALAYLVIVLAMGALGWFASVTIARLGLEVVTRIKKELFAHFLRLPVAYFDAHPVGELMSRTESDTEKIKELFSRTAITLATDFLLFAGMLAVCFFLDPRVTIWIALAAPVVLVLVILFFDKLRVFYDRHRVLYAKILANVTEFVQGIEILRAFGRIPWAEKRLGENSKARRDNDIKSSILEYSAMGGVGFAIGPLFMCAVVLAIAPGIIEGRFTIGTLLVFLEYGRRIFDPLMSIAENIRAIQQARVSLKRIFGILELPVEEGRDRAPARFDRSIEFRHVWFAYKDEDWVLEDVSFTIPKGSTVALVGPSGSGKTTTVGLLSRFYRPTKGEILVDGRPLEELDLEGWRRLLGLVLQDVFLFPGSVLENVRIYDEDISRGRVGDALASVQAGDFVEKLPEGLDAELKERGSNISSGEKQLVAFARAVAFDPEIIVLDEATASIDVVTERRIREGMAGLIAGRTAVIVAHRLSSVLRADEILFFRDGRIAARGRHEELARAFPEYAELVRLQFPDLGETAIAEAAGTAGRQE